MTAHKCIDIIQSAIQNYSHPGPPDSRLYQPTSVIALFVQESELKLLFIQKAEQPGYPWSGQMAFPGGHQDPEDVSTKDTALRELKEELGIRRRNVTLIGSLGHFQTINSRDIETWVGIWNQKDTIQSDPHEISRVIKIPLKYLIRVHKEKGYHVFKHAPDIMQLTYPYEDVSIWGVTAKMLYHLINTLIKAA